MVQTMLRFASLAVLSLTILGCGGEKPPVLKVCATGNVGFFHLKNGQPSGVEYDILNSFAESQSIGIEVSWDDPVQVLEKVVAEQCEIGAGIFTPTPARKESLDFSVSYFPVKVLVLTKADTAVQTVEDLAGKRIAVINGSSQPAIAETIPGVEPVLVSSIEETAEAVMNGTADVTILDSILAPSLLKAYPDLQPMFF
ncbi:MAG: transporter substrate-binding domain-containing protein, partial [bacterium]|nr:transporter substrate-binding domain-containing protein [bacterium]